MSFTLTAGWNDSSVSGTARIVAHPGGQTILVPVVAGELRFNGQRGVPLDANPGTTYVMFFDGFSAQGMAVSLNPVAIPVVADGSTADVGGMTANAHTNYVKKHS